MGNFKEKKHCKMYIKCMACFPLIMTDLRSRLSEYFFSFPDLHYYSVLQIAVSAFFKSFYSFERQSYRKRGRKVRKIFHMLVHAPDDHNGQGQTPRAASGSPMCGYTWTMLYCNPKHIGRELDPKRSSWRLTQCPYGMLALHTGA